MYLPLINDPDQGLQISAFELYKVLMPKLSYLDWFERRTVQFDMDEYIDYWILDDNQLSIVREPEWAFSLNMAMQIARTERTPLARLAYEHLANLRRKHYRALGIHKIVACQEALRTPGLN